MHLQVRNRIRHNVMVIRQKASWQLLVLCTLLYCLPSCQTKDQEPTYVVGVSIDFYDVWHDKMCDEIVQEAVLHPELQLVVKNAYGDRSRQQAQIDSMVNSGVDLLIIGVEDPMYIRMSLDNAAAHSVPVVINSRNPKIDNYTAFVGTDNVRVGHLMADYLKELAVQGQFTPQHPLRAVEMLGVLGVPAVVERYRGLREGLSDCADVQIAGTGFGKWSQSVARQQTDSLLTLLNNDVDVIVAQNDIMAMGCYYAALSRCPDKDFHILGVDALSGTNSGVEAILEGKIAASITNVAHGDVMVKTACAILHQQPYPRDTFLQPMLVDQSSTRLMMRMSQEMNNETKVIKTMQTQMDTLGTQTEGLKTVNMALILCLILAVLLGVAMTFMYRYRLRLHKERAQNAIAMARQQQQLDQMSAELTRVKEEQNQEGKFYTNLQTIIEKRLNDPNLSVDSLSQEMGMSRAQLFRKVREQLGITPLDLIRQIRLQKGQQMLQKTDMSISQVAYSVGFSSPSYFSKCYREYFGVTPAEDRDK